MRIEFKTVTIIQTARKGAPQPITVTSDQFSNSILNAEAALNGWDLRFTGQDHHYHDGFVKIQDVEVVDRRVKVTALMGIRDNSGDWDDTYEGEANVLIIASIADN